MGHHPFMSEEKAAANLEVEIKVRLVDCGAFAAELEALGFRLETAETAERNLLFDTRDGRLRRNGELLRIRRYGDMWKLTHKARVSGSSGSAHKIRAETETVVADGEALAAIFAQLGYEPVFIYEKLRAEWSDGVGHVVVDRTPIGDFAELEGEPGWIDRTASALGLSRADYLTVNYARLFQEWKSSTRSSARNMTFAETGRKV
jgi:adenylate cyclase class 2